MHSLISVAMVLGLSACSHVASKEDDTSRAPAAVTSGDTLVQLLESMPGGYAYRHVCLADGQAIGFYSNAKSWLDRNAKYFGTYGDLIRFPKTEIELKGGERPPTSMDRPKDHTDWKRFPVLKQQAKHTRDQIFYARGEIKVNGKSYPADCAFESGPRPE